MAEIKKGLTDGETVITLNLLTHKSEQLAQIRDQLDVADTYVESLFVVEPAQNTVTIATQGEKRTATEVVIEQCEVLIRSKKSVLEEKIAADKAAVAKETANAVATVLATPTPTTTAAPGKVAPKVERLEMPDFKGGQLRDYAKWR